MSTRNAPVPLLELAAAAPLDHVEAVTLVREIVQCVLRNDLPGIPSAQVVRLSPSGGLTVEGPIAADGSAVRRAAQLLDTLLPPFDAHVRVPGGLRLIVARALGALDLPPYPSLESFADALSRFAAVDPEECLRQVVANRPEELHVVAGEVIESTPESTITVSDIRRARRATGMALCEVARRSRVPVHLLRELEWGYLENWPPSHIGRRLIKAYARAAGLDEELVTSAVWPLLTESVRSRGAVPVHESELPVVVDVPLDAMSSALVTSFARIEPVVKRRWDARRIVAVLTIPALLAIGAAPALWQQHSAARRESPSRPIAQTGEAAPARQPEVPTPIRQTESAQVVAPPSSAPAPSALATEVPSAYARQARTSNGSTRQVTYRSQPPGVVKNTRPPVKLVKAQPRPRASRTKGARKWGIWVLNKVGVRIINTEQQ